MPIAYSTILRIAGPGILVAILASCTGRHGNPQSASGKILSEPFRPEIHFTPPAHWMNDPNGLVYHAGKWQLYYQYYPGATVWGPMHWGHAVSTDLVHWKHLPVALYPDSAGYIFSGSAVFDSLNTSGFGTREKPPLVAMFTRHDPKGEKSGRNNFQNQCIAYSLDEGMSWTKYNENPVIPNPGEKDFRDPKVFWYAPLHQWVVILAAYDHVELWRSSDLKSWNKASEFGSEYGAHGGVWECPDLFPLQSVDGQSTKWVMLVSVNPGGPNQGSGTQYFTGDFDGLTFRTDQKKNEIRWLDYGPDDYAGVTWSNAPANRKVFIGWMNNWAYAQDVPTVAWRGAMTVPRDLALVRSGGHFLVTSSPSPELQHLVARVVYPDIHQITDSVQLGDHIQAAIISGSLQDHNFWIELCNKKNQRLTIGYNREESEFFVDRSESGEVDFSRNFQKFSRAPRLSTDPVISFTLVIDVASVEVFFDDGGTVLTSVFYAKDPLSRCMIKSTDSMTVENLKIEYLKGIQ